MIPRIIHYCWFGGNPKPHLALACIASWRKHLPEYQFMEWNEGNYDVHSNQYTHEAHSQKKWAFVSDYVRLVVLHQHGGIYLDVDVEVTQSLDKLLTCRAFTGFEAPNRVSTGIIGAEKNHPWVEQLLSSYAERKFIRDGGAMDMTTNVTVVTASALEKGLRLDGSFQVLEEGVHFYPTDWFCPINYETGKMERTPNTHCIHHFAGSWLSPYTKLKLKLRRAVLRFLGKGALDLIVSIKRSVSAVLGRFSHE